MNYNATSIRRRTSLLIIALGAFAMSFGQSKSLLAGTEVGAQLKSAAVKENTWAYGKDPAKEDVSKRDFNSKHFKNDDGTYTGVFSAGIIHYEDGGKYYDIDANIQPNLLGNHAAYSYVNSTNLMKSYFANHSSGGLLSVSTEGEVKEFLNTRFYWEKNGTAFNSISSTDVASTVDGNKITYKNLYPAVDAQYTLSAGRRELNYIINDASILSSVPSGADYMVFAEDIQIDANWSYELSQEGTVILKDISGRMVYEYESPVVGDGFGAANYRPLLADNNIADIQAQRNGNTLTVMTRVSTTWLKDPARVFPLAIDPTGTYYPSTSLASSAGYTRKTGAAGATKVNGNIFMGRVGAVNDLVRGWCQFDMTSLYSILGTAITGNVSDMRMKIAATRLGSAGINAGPLTSVNPASASAASLYTALAINASQYYGVFTATGLPATGALYGGSLIGNGSAYNPITHLNTNFGAGNQYFNVAFRATNDGTAFANNTYWTLNGAAGGALAPVLEVDYTSPASPPSCTSYISPTNAITNSATGVQLTWNAEGSADSYDVYFGTSSTPPLAGNTASITYNPGCLLPNTQYYWQIVPKNTYGSASGCSVWSFTTADKIAMYTQNFDGFTQGMFSEVTPQDGWLASSTAAQSGNYRNVWSCYNKAPYSVSGNSVGISGFNGNAPTAGGELLYWEDLPTARWFYRTIPATGFKDIQVSFRYKVGGEYAAGKAYDYGTVISSIDGGATYLLDSTGGNDGIGQYFGQATPAYSTVVFPSSRDNDPDFTVAFRWISDGQNSSDPSFVVDDIMVSGCPLGGNITPLSSSHLGSGSSTLTVNGSATCALYQWEQSTTATGPWADVTTGTGGTTNSYTTPALTSTTYYRCNVHYGSCTPSYQSSVAVVTITTNCTTPAITAKANGTATSLDMCSGNGITLTANPVGSGTNCSGTYEYTWTDGANYWDGSNFTLASPTYNVAYSSIVVSAAVGATYATTIKCSNDAACVTNSNVVVTVLSAPTGLAAVIGSPANGATHHMTVSWNAVSGATSYDIDYSPDGSSWSNIATAYAGTSYDDNRGNSPNAPCYYRVRAKKGAASCAYTEMTTPKYTACDFAATPTVSNPSGSSVQVTVAVETPGPIRLSLPTLFIALQPASMFRPMEL